MLVLYHVSILCSPPDQPKKERAYVHLGDTVKLGFGNKISLLLCIHFIISQGLFDSWYFKCTFIYIHSINDISSFPSLVVFILWIGVTLVDLFINIFNNNNNN